MNIIQPAIYAETVTQVRAAVQMGAKTVVVTAPTDADASDGACLPVRKFAECAEFCRNRDALIVLSPFSYSSPIRDANISRILKVFTYAARAGFNGAEITDVGLLRAAKMLLPDFPFTFTPPGYDTLARLSARIPQSLLTAAAAVSNATVPHGDAKKPRFKGGAFNPPLKPPLSPINKPFVNVMLSGIEQYSDELAKLSQIMYVSIGAFLDNAAKFRPCWEDNICEICLVLPFGVRMTEISGIEEIPSALALQLDECKQLGVTSCLVSDFKQLAPLISRGFTVHGGEKLDVTHTQSVLALKRMGVRLTALSKSLSDDEIRDVFKYIPCEAAYTPERFNTVLGLHSVRLEFTNESARECLIKVRRILS